MKDLIFSHNSDIDGMGGIVLLKLAKNNEIDYELCETFNINKKFKEYYMNKKLYDYDNIYITDLCLDLENLEIVKQDEILSKKIKIFDHHESVYEFNKYDFVDVTIQNEKGFCCGTMIFYDYLLSNNIIASTIAIEQFAELTRRYDTWEWKTIYNDEKARDLSLLFESVGAEKYIDIMYKKLKESSKFYFSEVEEFLIENRKAKLMEKVLFYVENIRYKEILGLKSAIVIISYEYRNEVAQYLIDNNYDVDFVILVAMDHGTISYRSIKPDVNVRIVAEYFGGKGHDNAAGSNISNEQKEKILELLLE